MTYSEAAEEQKVETFNPGLESNTSNVLVMVQEQGVAESDKKDMTTHSREESFPSSSEKNENEEKEPEEIEPEIQFNVAKQIISEASLHLGDRYGNFLKKQNRQKFEPITITAISGEALPDIDTLRNAVAKLGENLLVYRDGETIKIVRDAPEFTSSIEYASIFDESRKSKEIAEVAEKTRSLDRKKKIYEANNEKYGQWRGKTANLLDTVGEFGKNILLSSAFVKNRLDRLSLYGELDGRITDQSQSSAFASFRLGLGLVGAKDFAKGSVKADFGFQGGVLTLKSKNRLDQDQENVKILEGMGLPVGKDIRNLSQYLNTKTNRDEFTAIGSQLALQIASLYPGLAPLGALAKAGHSVVELAKMYGSYKVGNDGLLYGAGFALLGAVTGTLAGNLSEVIGYHPISDIGTRLTAGIVNQAIAEGVANIAFKDDVDSKKSNYKKLFALTSALGTSSVKLLELGDIKIEDVGDFFRNSQQAFSEGLDTSLENLSNSVQSGSDLIHDSLDGISNIDDAGRAILENAVDAIHNTVDNSEEWFREIVGHPAEIYRTESISDLSEILDGRDNTDLFSQIGVDDLGSLETTLASIGADGFTVNDDGSIEVIFQTGSNPMEINLDWISKTDSSFKIEVPFKVTEGNQMGDSMSLFNFGGGENTVEVIANLGSEGTEVDFVDRFPDGIDQTNYISQKANGVAVTEEGVTKIYILNNSADGSFSDGQDVMGVFKEEALHTLGQEGERGGLNERLSSFAEAIENHQADIDESLRITVEDKIQYNTVDVANNTLASLDSTNSLEVNLQSGETVSEVLARQDKNNLEDYFKGTLRAGLNDFELTEKNAWAQRNENVFGSSISYGLMGLRPDGTHVGVSLQDTTFNNLTNNSQFNKNAMIAFMCDVAVRHQAMDMNGEVSDFRSMVPGANATMYFPSWATASGGATSPGNAVAQAAGNWLGGLITPTNLLAGAGIVSALILGAMAGRPRGISKKEMEELLAKNNADLKAALDKQGQEIARLKEQLRQNGVPATDQNGQIVNGGAAMMTGGGYMPGMTGGAGMMPGGAGMMSGGVPGGYMSGMMPGGAGTGPVNNNNINISVPGGVLPQELQNLINTLSGANTTPNPPPPNPPVNPQSNPSNPSTPNPPPPNPPVNPQSKKPEGTPKKTEAQTVEKMKKNGWFSHLPGWKSRRVKRFRDMQNQDLDTFKPFYRNGIPLPAELAKYDVAVAEEFIKRRGKWHATSDEAVLKKLFIDKGFSEGMETLDILKAKEKLVDTILTSEYLDKLDKDGKDEFIKLFNKRVPLPKEEEKKLLASHVPSTPRKKREFKMPEITFRKEQGIVNRFVDELGKGLEENAFIWNGIPLDPILSKLNDETIEGYIEERNKSPKSNPRDILKKVLQKKGFTADSHSILDDLKFNTSDARDSKSLSETLADSSFDNDKKMGILNSFLIHKSKAITSDENEALTTFLGTLVDEHLDEVVAKDLINPENIALILPKISDAVKAVEVFQAFNARNNMGFSELAKTFEGIMTDTQTNTRLKSEIKSAIDGNLDLEKLDIKETVTQLAKIYPEKLTALMVEQKFLTRLDKGSMEELIGTQGEITLTKNKELWGNNDAFKALFEVATSGVDQRNRDKALDFLIEVIEGEKTEDINKKLRRDRLQPISLVVTVNIPDTKDYLDAEVIQAVEERFNRRDEELGRKLTDQKSKVEKLKREKDKNKVIRDKGGKIIEIKKDTDLESEEKTKAVNLIRQFRKEKGTLVKLNKEMPKQKTAIEEKRDVIRNKLLESETVNTGKILEMFKIFGNTVEEMKEKLENLEISKIDLSKPVEVLEAFKDANADLKKLGTSTEFLTELVKVAEKDRNALPKVISKLEVNEMNDLIAALVKHTFKPGGILESSHDGLYTVLALLDNTPDDLERLVTDTDKLSSILNGVFSENAFIRMIKPYQGTKRGLGRIATKRPSFEDILKRWDRIPGRAWDATTNGLTFSHQGQNLTVRLDNVYEDELNRINGSRKNPFLN